MPSRSARNRPSSARLQRIAEQQAVLQQLQSGGGITAYPASPVLGAARTLLGKGPMGTVYGAELGGKSVLKMPGGMSQTGFLGPINVAGQTWYPAKKGEDVIFMQSDGSGGFGRAAEAAQDVRVGGLFKPTATESPNKIELGVDAQGNVDLTQGDEYRAQMAQYRNLIAKEKEQEAEDLGMKIWQEKYGKTPMAQPGGAVGAYNPLLAKMFPETKGFAGTFAPVEEVQMGDLGTRAQGEFGPTMESLGLLNKQEAQQQATANQADMATTVKLPIRNRVQAFLQGGM